MHVKIKGYTFSLSAPYSAGHELTPGEAQALNNLRAENIQNNFRDLVNEQHARTEPGQLIQQSVLDGLQDKLTEYDSTYKFFEKAGRSRTGDIEREARAIAAARVSAQLTETGGNSNLLDPKNQMMIDATAMLPAVIEEARARVAAQRAVIAGGMDSL